MVKKLVGAALGAAALVYGVAAQAAYTITLRQVGPDVVATGSGSFSLAGLGTPVSSVVGGFMLPAMASVGVGPVPPMSSVDVYMAPMSGPADFGTGAVPSFANSGSGAPTGINGTAGAIGVPMGYVANTPLGTSAATWTGQTFASLGVTPGTYVWTWGSGPTADSFTLIVGGASNIPTLSEWGAVSLAAALGLLGFATLRRRRG